MRILLSIVLVLALVAAACGSDSSGVTAESPETTTSVPETTTSVPETTTTAPETTTTTTPETTTTTAREERLAVLAADICADFAAEYAEAADRPVKRWVLGVMEDFEKDHGYWVMMFDEDMPYANAVAKLEALQPASADDEAEAKRLIDAMNAASEANDLAVDPTEEDALLQFAFAVYDLAQVAAEIGLDDCADLSVPNP